LNGGGNCRAGRFKKTSKRRRKKEKKKPNVKKKENLMISALPLYPHQVDNKVG
jgi:hypothetical protein